MDTIITVTTENELNAVGTIDSPQILISPEATNTVSSTIELEQTGSTDTLKEL